MVGKNKDNFNKLSVNQILDSILDRAVEVQANFIHIEPSDSEVLIKCRVSGELREIAKLPKKRFDSLLTRLKLVSNMNPRERYTPQEGRFKFQTLNKQFVMRVSILPTIQGEKVAINVLDDSAEPVDLDKLGFWGSNLLTINKALESQNGLILLVGPNESGKSTTIFSMLSNLKDPNKKIITIEDPVEFRLPLANQIQINRKINLTYKTALQSILKHDANLIMIDTLANPAVAKLAFSVASRGKLIISTLHGDSDQDVVKKLISYGVAPFEIAHILRIVINQRLVRRLCPNCRVSFVPDNKTASLIAGIYSTNKPPVMKYIHNLEIKYVSEKDNQTKVLAKNLSTTETRFKRLWKSNPDGCSECLNSGYLARLGVNEILTNTSFIQSLISTHASYQVVTSQARKEGMIPMMTDALIKALQGETSLDQIVQLASFG